MTTITHGPDGPRFDGMTVEDVIATLDTAATIGTGNQLLSIAVAALRHLSERVAELEAAPDRRCGTCKWWDQDKVFPTVGTCEWANTGLPASMRVNRKMAADAGTDCAMWSDGADAGDRGDE